MVKKCSILSCPIKARTKVGQFSFPIKRDLCQKWVAACGRGPDFSPASHSRICEIHFAEEDFKPDEGRQRKRLKPGVVPTLNLRADGLTEEGQRVLALQRDADQAALELAKQNLDRQLREEEEARLARAAQPVPSDPLMPSSPSSIAIRSQESFQINIEPLQDREGLKISIPQKLAKNPKKISRVFRDKDVLEMIKFHSCKSSSHLTSKGKRKRTSRDATFTFTICPVIEGEDNQSSPTSNDNNVKRIGNKTIQQLLNDAASQNCLGAKKRRVLPSWFRQGTSGPGPRPPPVELGRLKPVPVSKALHLLFDLGIPDLPLPPLPLPPIAAKLIFVDRTNFERGQVTEMRPEKMSDPDENALSIKLEIPSELPSGPIAILDPDGLRREVEHWRSQVDELQKKNYDLEVKLSTANNEKRKLLLKIKAVDKSRDRESQIQTKKKIQSNAKMSKLKTELSILRKFRRQVINNEKLKKQKKAKTSDQENMKEYIVDHIQQDNNGSYACKRVMPNDHHQILLANEDRTSMANDDQPTIIVETDSTGRTTATSSRNLKEFFSQVTYDQMTPQEGSTILGEIPQNLDSTTTTVMLPSEAIYTTDNGEYQHIEIITMDMDGLEPTWRRVVQE